MTRRPALGRYRVRKTRGLALKRLSYRHWRLGLRLRRVPRWVRVPAPEVPTA